MTSLSRLLVTSLLLPLLLLLASCDSIEETIDVITQTPELELVIASRMSPVIEEDEALIMVVASNTGAVDAENVLMQMILPGNIHRFTAPPGADCPGVGCDGGETMTWDIGRLAEGDSRVLLLHVEPNDSVAPSDLPFSATLDADGANTVNRTISISIAENDGPGYELIFVADANPGALSPGETTELRVAYVNGSASAYSGATLNVTLPADMTIVSAGQGGVTQGQTVSWDLGQLDPLDGGIRSLTARVDSGRDAGETLIVSSRLSAGTNYSESLSLAIPVVQQRTMDLSVGADVSTATEDTPFTVTLDVSNPTTTDLENTVVRITLPDGIYRFTAPAETDCPGVGCDDGETMTWDIGRLSAGQSRTLIFSIEIDDEAIGTPLPFTARADADGVSPALAALTLPTGE